jgi:hypothetical protein
VKQAQDRPRHLSAAIKAACRAIASANPIASNTGAAIAQEIEKSYAQREIFVNAYALTTWFGHLRRADPSSRSRRCGVGDRAEKWTPCEQKQGLSPLAAAGIPVWIEARARIAHEEALIIDPNASIMGSYSFSAAPLGTVSCAAARQNYVNCCNELHQSS